MQNIPSIANGFFGIRTDVPFSTLVIQAGGGPDRIGFDNLSYGAVVPEPSSIAGRTFYLFSLPSAEMEKVRDEASAGFFLPLTLRPGLVKLAQDEIRIAIELSA